MNREKIIDEFDRKFFVIPKGAFIDEIKQFLLSKIAEAEREAVKEYDRELYLSSMRFAFDDNRGKEFIEQRKAALARRGIGEENK